MKWYNKLLYWLETFMCPHDWIPKSSITQYQKDTDDTLFICTKCGKEA